MFEVNETLNNGAFKLHVVINEKTPDKVVLDNLDSACKEFGTIQGTLVRFSFVIGRILTVVKERNLFKPAFKTFDRYLVSAVIDKYGISRATIFRGLQAARTVPEISAEQATAIGTVKMLSIAAAMRNQADKLDTPAARQKFVDHLIKDAGKLSAPDFQGALMRNQYIPAKGASNRSRNTIVIRTTPEVVDLWKTYCGDRDPAEVFTEIVTARAKRAVHTMQSQSSVTTRRRAHAA